MFLAALFTIARSWKQPSASADEWIKEMGWYSHTMEYYVAKKRNEALIQTTTWMNLENMVLRERSQTQKDNVVWFHLYEVPRIANSEAKNRTVLTGSWGWELEGTELFEVMKMEITMVTAQCWEYSQCHWIVHLKMIKMEDFPGSPVVKILCICCTGYIPSQRTKIPHAPWPKQIKMVPKQKPQACARTSSGPCHGSHLVFACGVPGLVQTLGDVHTCGLAKALQPAVSLHPRLSHSWGRHPCPLVTRPGRHVWTTSVSTKRLCSWRWAWPFMAPACSQGVER